MKYSLIKNILLGTLGVMALSTAYADGDKIKGASYYAICAGCHGADAMGMEATNARRQP